VKNQKLLWTGSTNFGPQCYQIRVIAQVAGVIKIDGPGATVHSRNNSRRWIFHRHARAGPQLYIDFYVERCRFGYGGWV